MESDMGGGGGGGRGGGGNCQVLTADELEGIRVVPSQCLVNCHWLDVNF